MDDPRCKIFAARLPANFSDKELIAAAIQFGDVEFARVATDGPWGCSRGFGFVVATTPAQADLIVDGLNGLVLRGNKLHASLTRPKR